MTAIFRRQILWIWLCSFCLILRALGEYILTTVPPGVNTTIYSNNTGPFSIDSLEVSIQEPIIEFRPTPPIVEPDLDPIGLQKPDDPFWNETGTPIQVDASQNSRRAEQYYGASTGSRNDAPGNRTESHNNSVGTITERSYIRPRSAIQNGITLRIMVLGASITWGAGSSDLNGFRYALRSALVAGGNPVNMVGSVNNGNMGDNQVEGWPGAIISELSEKADNTLPQRPNVVIIQCGSNDMSRNIDPPGAAARMGALVDKILAVVPETLILVTGLMPMSNNMANDLSVNIYNPGLRAMVNEKSEEGKNVWFVDMNDGYITLSDLADGLHPSDGGFLKMARLYYDALVNLGDYIKPPQRVLGVDDTAAQSQPGSGGEIDTKCQKVPGNAIGPIQTQQGSGGNDGPYVHKGVDHGKLLYWQGPPSSPQDVPVINGVFWADMNGDGYDDLVYVPKNFQEIQVSINLGISGGKVVFADRLTLNTGIDCPTAGVNFADSNDNGIDDLFCIGANGDLRIWQNRPTTGGIPFANTWVGSSSIDMAGKLGFPLSRVRIADVDGDGRADYAIIRDNGDIEAWRNGGVLPTVAYWQNLGIVSSGKTFNDLSGIRLVDINGDGRDDLLWISDTGTVTTWINHRGFSTGSLAPDWMPGIVTHGGPGIAGTRAGITFGKVWAGPLTRNHDYMITTITESLPGVQIYENQGVGGRNVNGDGVFYCDMTGNGADDYIYVSASGDFHLFGNYQNPPAWLQYGVIYQRQFSSRKQIHFADWNGDGRCDILFVDRLDGRVNMARNDGFVDGKLKFYDYGLVSSTARCYQGYGNGFGDLGVRFAHISGKPRVDYLCIQKNGMTTGYINRGINDMVDVGQIKAPIGADRANIRYADVNGDGKDDCLWVDKFTGKTSVWTNEGEDPSRPSGSFNRWQFRGVIAYGGSARGANIYWAKMKNQQRADYVINNPATNKANAYFNVCPKVPAVGPAPNLAPGPIRPLDYPFPSQRSFYSIGDSYSAGIGTGEFYYRDAYDTKAICLRGDGSFGMQLNSIYLQSKKLEFAACTGAVVKDVLDNVEGRSRPLSQLNLLHDLSVPAGGWATLTIGGNDVWFSKVIVKCFFAQRYAGQCNDQLERSEQEIHSKAFADKLWQTYMRILQQSTLPGFTLVVLSYPRLFNGLELRCDDKSFVTGGRYIAPKLSLEKRQRVNAAISTVNELIKQTVIEIRNRQLLERSKKRIFYYEVDNHYWYHRYCDFQNSDGTPRDWKDDAWFFTIFGDDDDGGVIPQDAERINVRDLDLTTCERKLEADELSGEEFDIACHFRAMLASDSDFDLPPPHSLTSFWPDGYKKGFHPKRVAHSEIARGIWLRWGSVWGPQPER